MSATRSRSWAALKRVPIPASDGPTSPAKVRRAGDNDLDLTITEGRNRQVRRMLLGVGNEVLALERIGFASLELGDLPLGESRQLSRSEVKRLWKDAEPMNDTPPERE